MSHEPTPPPADAPSSSAPTGPQEAPTAEQYEEGKRAGAHPLVVIFAVIFGLWIVIFFVFAPGNKRDRPDATLSRPDLTEHHDDAAPVIFKVHATAPQFKAISLVVPEGATHSQIVTLLKSLRTMRKDHELEAMLPPTTEGHELGPLAYAEIFIFSDKEYASADTIARLARGAKAPTTMLGSVIPFEVAMEHVRGHYRIDLANERRPDAGSLGFADPSGVHSEHYRKIF
ncbi:hypothetical protein YTPLAS18_11530 [Nitrospira sp.]|nr:hypothetical protein YTPLAS18_11530 [Nitrospira sp.]